MSAETAIHHPTAETPVDTADGLSAKPKRLIGSQRNPDAYRPKPTIAVVGENPPPVDPPPTEPLPTVPQPSADPPLVDPIQTATYPPEGVEKPPKPLEDDPDDEMPDHISAEGEKKLKSVPPKPVRAVAVPKYRGGKLSDDLEAEFSAVFGNDEAAVSAILKRSEELSGTETLETDTKVRGKIISIQGDSVFFDVGAREQGIVSLRMFPADAEPKPGDEMDVTVVRFLKAEGLYDVSVPLAAADVRDWSQVQEGMIVEALITKTNTGGLECEVNRLRGFIPLSQVELFRVENFEQYVGKKLTCVVEEVNAERRNLVLSRKAMLLREQEEKKQQLLAELEVGQTREGLVRKIIDAGAFIDLGGVDGFVPIGALAWGRVRHPSEVLTEGTRIMVRVTKIEEGTNRISLTYRDEASNPWSNITERFQEKTLARGKVSKAMDFGAFVELMPGVEGLVHISELSSKRVNNVSEVVKEGDWVDVYILDIDAENKRMSLSIKQATVSKTPATESEEGAEGEEAPAKPKNVFKGPLKGGTGQSAGGEKFGLKW